MAPVISFGQEADKMNRNPAKRQKELEKTKLRQERDQAQAIEELKKKHYNNQTKAVKKRMKKTAKRSANHNNNKGKFSIKKLFRKRR